MNHGVCVNTLREECKKWIEKHSKDGKNHTAKARYPCYFMSNNTEFVVTRHDVEIIEVRQEAGRGPDIQASARSCCWCCWPSPWPSGPPPAPAWSSSPAASRLMTGGTSGYNRDVTFD